MRGSRGVAALIVLLAALIAAWIGGGREWNGGAFTRLISKLPSSTVMLHRPQPFVPHCSLLRPSPGNHDFVLAAERVVLPDGVFPAAIVVSSDGKIKHVHPLSPSSASTNLAAAAALATGRKSNVLIFKRDSVLGPGLVDAHVHANEPGRARWEGLGTATAAAVAGGITTVVDMPLNSAPAATSARILKEKARAVEAVKQRGEGRPRDSTTKSRGGLSCDVGLWAGLVPSNAGDPAELTRMFSSRGVLGFKAFLSPSGIGDFERTSVSEAEAAMPVFRDLGAPLLLHAELLPEHRREGGSGESKGEVVEVTDLESWAASRPEEMEVAAVEEVIAALARVVAAAAAKDKRRNNASSSLSSNSFRVHLAHVAAPAALPLIAEAKARGLPLSAETCPHYLGLLDPLSPPERGGEGAEKKGGKRPVLPSLLKCAPPLRVDAPSVASRKLWQALMDGTLDSVASDHSPTTPAMKRDGKEKEKEEDESESNDDDDNDNKDKNKNNNNNIDKNSFARAWGGISGLQFLLPSTWSSSPSTPETVEAENALAANLHRWLSSAPAALAGLSKRKGAISEGLDADFVVWKPRALADVSFEGCRLRHCENSPFVGTGGDLKMRGRVVATFLRGQLVFSAEGEKGGEGRVTGCGGRLLERD